MTHSLASIERVVKRVTIGPPLSLWQPELSVTHIGYSQDEEFALKLRWQAVNSKPPYDKIHVLMTRPLPMECLQNDADIIEMVHAMTKDWVMHELHESLYLDGKLLDDPHKEES